jgi:hypothetical protein
LERIFFQDALLASENTGVEQKSSLKQSSVLGLADSQEQTQVETKGAYLLRISTVLAKTTDELHDRLTGQTNMEE